MTFRKNRGWFRQLLPTDTGAKIRTIYLSRLSLAHGSLMALETDILAASRLGFISVAEIEPIISQSAEVGRMLHGLMKSLRGHH